MSALLLVACKAGSIWVRATAGGLVRVGQIDPKSQFTLCNLLWYL